MTLEQLDTAATEQAGAALLQCCGSETWVNGMLVLRPFGDRDALHAAADQVWWSLSKDDWLEAFSKHPRIGEKNANAKWSSAEQAGMNVADQRIAEDMRRMNQQYEDRFGYIYIVCAAGKSAAELHRTLEDRLKNQPAEEMHNAAKEQAKITHLRLEKLLTE